MSAKPIQRLLESAAAADPKKTLDIELAKEAEETRKVKPSKPFEVWMTWYVDLGSYTLEVAQGGWIETQAFKVVRGAAAQSFFEFVGEPGK